MKYAIIKDSKVLNIIEADETNAGTIAASMGASAVQSDIAKIGQSYSNGVFADIVISEQQRQDAKPLALKQAENAYLTITTQIPNYTAGMNATAISGVLNSDVELGTLTLETAHTIALELLGAIHDVEICGGTWKDLPATPHVIA